MPERKVIVVGELIPSAFTPEVRIVKGSSCGPTESILLSIKEFVAEYRTIQVLPPRPGKTIRDRIVPLDE